MPTRNEADTSCDENVEKVNYVLQVRMQNGAVAMEKLGSFLKTPQLYPTDKTNSKFSIWKFSDIKFE